MTLADTRLRRDIQKELVKREIESNLINVSVVNGVVYLEGDLRAIRGTIMDLRRERDIMDEVIRHLRGVRDVVNNIRVPL